MMRNPLPLLLTLLSLSALGVQQNSGEYYLLGSGDLIEIEVLNVPNYKHLVRIDSEGNILLPYLGTVLARGNTTSQLAGELTRKMNDEIFRNPAVSVSIKEHASQPISILGAVRAPGTYQIKQANYTLLELLSAAGGIASTADDRIIINRGDREGESEPIEVALSDLYGARLSALNFQLQPGDVVRIPPREEYNPNVYFVIGEVLRPGDFTFPKDRSLLLTQAVAAAGGTLKTAKANDGILVRYNEDGSQTRIPIPFKKMMAGKVDDIRIRPDDIIFIPGSNSKTIMYGLLGVIPSTVQQATTTVGRP